MADFASAKPTEAAKSDYLHDRSRIPGPPQPIEDAARSYWGMALGFALAMLGVALVFETRSGWSSHRDWVTPAGSVLAVVAGLAMGYVWQRGRPALLGTAGFFLGLALIFTIFNVFRKEMNDGHDNGQTALTILATICLVATFIAAAVAALIVARMKPAPEPPPEG